jgi:hypothetical protein
MGLGWGILYLSDSGYVLVAGSFEYGYDHSGSMKYGKFLGRKSTILKESNFIPWS